jgi:RNA polymerase sigma factor (sigma-70 family)
MSTQAVPFPDELIGLYRDQSRPLVHLVAGFASNRGDAEDLVQEAFLRLQRVWPTIDHGPAVKAYLRTTVINLARSSHRRGEVARRHCPPKPPPQASAEAQVIGRDNEQRLVDVVLRLPDRQRQCVVLHYWEALPESEIAWRLGISRNSVKTHLRRGLTALTLQLRDPGTGE